MNQDIRRENKPQHVRKKWTRCSIHYQQTMLFVVSLLLAHILLNIEMCIFTLLEYNTVYGKRNVSFSYISASFTNTALAIKALMTRILVKINLEVKYQSTQTFSV